jgi:DNA-binding beta-propeller fold protein YncE
MMSSFRLIQRTLGICAGAILAACSAGGQPPQLGSASAMNQGTLATNGAASLAQTSLNGSWMAPDAKAISLVYVSEQGPASGSYHVLVYSYARRVLKGDLLSQETPAGLCADKAGDVWIGYGPPTPEMVEYKHGGTMPIATLSFPGEHPTGCSVDPITGNLAVTNLFGPSSVAGSVEVYADAQGTPTDYALPQIFIAYACGYDNAGNLFVDGQSTSGGFEFDKLPAGGKPAVSVTLNQTIHYPGGVQWDGTHVAVGEQGVGGFAPVIYRFKIKGTKGALFGKPVPLNGLSREYQFWKQGATVLVPDSNNGDVGFWRYPQGGSPTQSIPGLLSPYGVALSQG